MKRLKLFLILFPFIYAGLNLQAFISWLVSESVAGLCGYAVIAMLVSGSIAYAKLPYPFSKTARIWIVFYFLYFTIGILSSIRYNFFEYFLVTLIQPIYFFSFFIFLRNPKNRRVFLKTMMITFFVASVIMIIFYHINFSMDHFGKPKWGVSRAGGVYADANNACLTALLSYVLLSMKYETKNKFASLFKILLILTTFYSIFITFSTTGLFIFAIIFFLVNYKLISKSRVFLIPFALPIFYILLANLEVLTQGLKMSKLQRDKISNIANLLKFNLDKVDNSGRDIRVARILNYIYEEPLLGNGLNFGEHIEGHNTYLNIWADSGFFCLVVFIFLIITYIISLLLSEIHTKFFGLAILVIMVIFMISLQTVINQPYLIALFVYLAYLIDEKKLIGKDAKSTLREDTIF